MVTIFVTRFVGRGSAVWAEEGHRRPPLLAWLTIFDHGDDEWVGLQMRQYFGSPLLPYVKHVSFFFSARLANCGEIWMYSVGETWQIRWQGGCVESAWECSEKWPSVDCGARSICLQVVFGRINANYMLRMKTAIQWNPFYHNPVQWHQEKKNQHTVLTRRIVGRPSSFTLSILEVSKPPNIVPTSMKCSILLLLF